MAVDPYATRSAPPGPSGAVAPQPGARPSPGPRGDEATARKKAKAEVVDEPVKVQPTKPQSPPPMPKQAPVSPFAPTVPQEAYKESTDSFGAAPESAAKRSSVPLVLAISIVVIVIAIVVVLALR
jgi:hypothetical protein